MAQTKTEALAEMVSLMESNPEIMKIDGSSKEIFIMPPTYIFDPDDYLKWYLRFVSNFDPSAGNEIVRVDDDGWVRFYHYSAETKSGWKITTVIRKEQDNAGD